MIIHSISKNMTAPHKCIRHSQYFHYFWKPLDVTSASLLSSSTMWTANLAQSLHPCWVLKQKYWPLMTTLVSCFCEGKADQWHPELAGTDLFSVLSPCILSNYLRTRKKNSTGFYCERPVIKSKKDTSWSAVPFFKITEGFRRSLGYRVRGDTHEYCGWSVPGQHGAPGTENFVSLSAPPGCYPTLPAAPDSQRQTLAQDSWGADFSCPCVLTCDFIGKTKNCVKWKNGVWPG